MRALLLTFLFASVLSDRLFAQSVEESLNGLEWSANVFKTEATFTFPPTKRNKWSWYNSETRDDLLEYSWNVMIGDHKLGFQFGPALFKPSGSQTANGSLSDLMNACQHDLWQVSEKGGHNVGEYGQTKPENGKVSVIISDPKLLEQLFGSKPETVHMMINTPEFMIRKKVSVNYSK